MIEFFIDAFSLIRPANVPEMVFNRKKINYILKKKVGTSRCFDCYTQKDAFRLSKNSAHKLTLYIFLNDQNAMQSN